MLFAVVLGPIYEELFFRGFLFPLLAKTFGAAAGIILSALPFALLHGAQNQWAWQQITLVGSPGRHSDSCDTGPAPPRRPPFCIPVST